MRKKIKSNLSIKVFLWVFSALTICCILLYILVMTVVPKRYQFAWDIQFEANTDAFFSDLESMTYDDAIRAIYNFCISNNATAILSHDDNTLSFGEMEAYELSTTTASFATNIVFSDNETEYTLIVSSISQTANKISGLFLKMIPVTMAVIILLSLFSAYICSKVIVTPIVQISEISKRMTSLDMTWHCDVVSDDEIGVLASSLNTMASRLQSAMSELKNANRQLTDDVKKSKRLEEQRRNFFAAVSHELKTPLTILKGQIENMILGYGDYKNHEKYLPEALRAVEDLEYLVKEITAIAKMQNMNIQDDLQEISLLDSVNHILEAVAPLIQDKNIQIHQNIETEMVLSVNSNLWNKALSNIIGNAIRHSPCGENVFISLQQCEQGNVFLVENTGTSIPEADFEYMFTPFYRADKSRSKLTGGSGLGLYIVKTILDLHGMNYCIRNTARGVEFGIYLNI